MRLFDKLHFVPQASAFNADASDGLAGTQYSDVFNLAKYRKILFVVQKGAGATGTATITVESCDTLVPGTGTAIAYKYKISTTLDTFGVTTAATTAGFTTTAGADQCYIIEVDASELSGTNQYVRVKTVEVANSPVDCMILAILGNARIAEDVMDTAIA